MFEPFQAASGTAKVVNLFILLFVFLSWVSTMVTFGSVLHRLSYTEGDGNGNSITYNGDFYWDHIRVSSPGAANSLSYTSSALDGLGLESCKGGGDGTLAFAIFAFLIFLVHIPLLVTRLMGINFPLARDTQHSLYLELLFTAGEFFCFFLTVCIWGGACFSVTRSLPGGGTVTGVGYGLMIACFFFLIVNFILYFMMRSNENLVLGNGAGRSGGGGGSQYESSGGGGEYQSDTQQPTFSYQANASDSGQL